jgi:four helix bundle protein
MARFEALEVALELAGELGGMFDQVVQHDRDIAGQMRRATTSVVSCLAEGAKRVGRDRLHLWRISAGSAAEVKAQLQLVVAWRYADAERAKRALELADRVVAMTWRLTRARA